MRYFVTILTPYINPSRAYLLYAYRREEYVYGRASRTSLRKLRKRGIDETEKEKEKRKRAQGDLLLMKNKYTTHADEPLLLLPL